MKPPQRTPSRSQQNIENQPMENDDIAKTERERAFAAHKHIKTRQPNTKDQFAFLILWRFTNTNSHMTSIAILYLVKAT